MNAKQAKAATVFGQVVSDTATKVRSLTEEARYALVRNDQPGLIALLNRIDGLMQDLQRRSSPDISPPPRVAAR